MSRDALFNIVWGQNRGMSLVVLVFALLNLGVYLGQTLILDHKLATVRTEVLERQQALRSLQQQKNAGSMPVSAVTQVESELTQFRQLIPLEKGLSGLIGDLFKYASSSKLDIKQITYSHERDEDLDLLSYTLKFSVKGDYKQLKKFIHLMEESDRILIISDIALSGGKRNKEKIDEVSLQIQVKTYFRGDTE